MKRWGVIVLFVLTATMSAQDMPLSQVLIEGEGWKHVVIKGWVRCLTTDGDGNPLVAASEKALYRRGPPYGQRSAFCS